MLRLIGEGLTNRQIGERMGLAEKTVKNYTSHLLAKLGLERRTQAAILATELRDTASGLSGSAAGGPRDRPADLGARGAGRTSSAARPGARRGRRGWPGRCAR